MFKLARGWTTPSGRSIYGQQHFDDTGRCCISIEVVPCDCNSRHVLRNHKSKQASGRHSSVGEDLADLVDVHDAGEGREPCGTQNTKQREKLSETQSAGRARAGRGERHGE